MIALQTADEWPDLSAGAEQQRSPITSSNEPASNPHYHCSLESRAELARAGPFPAVESRAFPGGGAPGSGSPATLAPPLSASGLQAVEGGLRSCWSRRSRAVAALLEVSRSCCGPRICRAVDAAATLSKGAARRGRGEALAHARVAVGGSGWRMRAASQQPGTLRGARPHSRAHACASLGFPAFAHSQSRSGACARYLRRTRVAGFPLLQAPASGRPLLVPSLPVPFLSSRNGAGATRGRAPRTRLALGLALSATARLAPPRALPQSLAPKAPLSSGGGGGSCFRFFLSLQSGVASSTQPPLPLPQRWAAAAKGFGGGDWGTAETASPTVSGKGAFGGPGPARRRVWGSASAGSDEAPGM